MGADFGLSTLMERASSIGFVGTFSYMPPEEWKGEEYTPKSDVFSFCVVAWEILTGKVPYVDQMDTLKREVMKIVNEGRSEDRTPTQILTDLFEHAVVNEDMRCKTQGLRHAKLLESGWAVDPEARPTFRAFLDNLERISPDGYSPPNLQPYKAQLCAS